MAGGKNYDIALPLAGGSGIECRVLTNGMTIDLSNSKVGDKVGSVIYHGHKCRGNLYRLPDANGRPRVVERFWHNENGICVEACILELQCDGTALDYRGLYPDGSYVAHAKLLRK